MRIRTIIFLFFPGALLAGAESESNVLKMSEVKPKDVELQKVVTAGLSMQDGSTVFEPYAEEIPGSSETIEMVPIPGVIFMMGDSENNDLRRKVRVEPFWMGTHEITWAQYELFVNEEIGNLEAGQVFINGDTDISADAITLPTPPYVDMSFGMGKDGYPAISMTHYAAMMFTRWLTVKTGKFYRLPTEAEWEFACRGGTDEITWYSQDTGELDLFEWHKENSNGSYNRVGTKEANPFGLYDMLGNVAEWTMDQYFEDYLERLDGEVADNPWFRPEQLYPRAVRGGSWQDAPEDLYCGKRRGSEAGWKRLDPQLPKSLWWHTSAPFVGFRIVRPKETPSKEEMERYWIGEMEDYY